MCGIVGYIGKRDAYPILIKGLQRLEYRGYDSAGVALFNGNLSIYKKEGKVKDLEGFVKTLDVSGSLGIGHTRWATHGEPNDTNAHPHISMSGNITLIHNGIIENYASLKETLVGKGYVFHSETDTEVLVNWIEEVQKQTGKPIAEAVRIALTKVVGAYAIAVIDKKDPTKLIAARKGSPLVVGIGEGEYFLGSDATPIIEYTKEVIYVNDQEIVTLDLENGLEIKSIIGNELQTPQIQQLDLEIELLEKGDFEHYMLKEIYEQPKTIADCLRGRLNAKGGSIKLSGMTDFENRLTRAKRLIIVACGTSWHAALIGEYLFEELARVPVEVEYASEFRYRDPIITEDDVIIAISQSGETADTLAALELARKYGALTYGICNVVGSSIPRITDAGTYIHVGPEIGVASTKAFTGQVTVLTMMAIELAYKRGTIRRSYYYQLLQSLENIPAKIERVLALNSKIKYIAHEIASANNSLYLGRGYNFPVALEGALKLKEISYIHAEGYPAAEMKHGPIALIDENMPVVIIATNKSAYEKIVSNIQEVKARKGKVIAIVTEGDTTISEIADYTIEIPETIEPLSPLISVVPLQLLSYHIALIRGCNVDQPRNLAKSVTVE
jgi:glucosamine--fructose-6-phosphate aminotransferase (isomerizing)